jgi:hypothetical protein
MRSGNLFAIAALRGDPDSQCCGFFKRRGGRHEAIALPGHFRASVAWLLDADYHRGDTDRAHCLRFNIWLDTSGRNTQWLSAHSIFDDRQSFCAGIYHGMVLAVHPPRSASCRSGAASDGNVRATDRVDGCYGKHTRHRIFDVGDVF